MYNVLISMTTRNYSRDRFHSFPSANTFKMIASLMIFSGKCILAARRCNFRGSGVTCRIGVATVEMTVNATHGHSQQSCQLIERTSR